MGSHHELNITRHELRVHHPYWPRDGNLKVSPAHPSVVSKSKAPNVVAKSANFLFKSTFWLVKTSESGTTAPSRPAEPKRKAGVLEQLYERMKPIPCVDVRLSTKVTKVSIQVRIIP